MSLESSTFQRSALLGRLPLAAQARSQRLGRMAQQAGAWRTSTEWLLALACPFAGLLMFFEGPTSGALGLIAGSTLAFEILARRTTPGVTLLGLGAFSACSLTSAGGLGLVVGLLHMAALAMPLQRGTAASVLLAQAYLISYLATYTAIDVTTHATAIRLPELGFNVLVFLAIAGAGNGLAARRRRLEHSLAAQVRHSEDLAVALERGEVLKQAILAIRNEQEEHGVLRALVAGANGLTRASAGTVMSLPGKDSPARCMLGRSYRIDRSPLLDWAIQNKAAVWQQEPLGKATGRGLPWGWRGSTLGLVPVLVSDRVDCVLTVRKERQEFGATERGMVMALAQQAGAALERVRLTQEVAHRADGAEALHRLAATLAGRREIEEVAAEVVTSLRALYGADAGVFYLVAPSADEDHPHGSRVLVANGIAADDFAGIFAEYSSGRRGQALRDGRSQVMTRSDDDRRRRFRTLLGERKLALVVDVPAMAREQWRGGLVLCHREARDYRPHELELLETFAQQLAGGIELAQAYQSVEAMHRQREELLAMVSHDLRQPVLAISTIAEGVAGSPRLDARERRAFEHLRQQAQTLSMFAEDVLSIAKLECGQLPLRPTEFDVRLLVEGLLRETLDADRLHLDTPQRDVTCWGDPERLGQVIDNLLSNALKYSPDGSPVGVRIEADAARVCIAVEDHGVGIEPADLPRLFQKYIRLPNERSRMVGGFGLGLYLSRLLVEAHGGTITAASPGVGLGATFTIAIPRRACSQ